ISRVSSRWARRSEPMPLCSASSASNVLPKTGSWSASRMNTPLLTTQLSLGAWPSFSAMRTPRCRKRPREQPSSRRGLGDLACVARGPIVMRHIGPPGATRSLLFVTERLRSRMQALRAPEAEQTPALRAAQHAAIYLRAQGFEVPAWETAAGLAG
ncbi:unnamed protein product, partial [Symbiodinium pilosum]